MKAISKLKDDARKHEQKEEWEQAIQVYLQVLQQSDDGEGEVELPLYNRVGDLCVRLGRPHEAVKHYEQAADRYAEAGLYNNAIALCNKALRYQPGRLELLRKLGQFSASQGFITDARRYFLEFAERQFAAGAVGEALTALEDFASVAEDAEVREMLGRRLQAHGRSEEALKELQRSHVLYMAEGAVEQAEKVAATIVEIDPAAIISDKPAGDRPQSRPAAEPHFGEPRAESLPGLADIDFGAAKPDAAASSDLPPSGGPMEGFEGTQLGDGTASTDDIGAIELRAFGAAQEPDTSDAGSLPGVEGFESTTLDFGAAAGEAAAVDFGLDIEHDERSFDLPTLDEDPTDAESAEGAFDLPTLVGDAATELPGLDDGIHDPDDDVHFELPTLDDADDVTSAPLPGPDVDPFELPELESAAADFTLPSFDDADEDDSGHGFTLPSLDDYDTGFSFAPPEPDDEPAGPDDVSFTLPDAADHDAPVLTPSDAASDPFALPALEPDEGSFSLPPADVDSFALPSEDEDGFDLPSLVEDTPVLPPADADSFGLGAEEAGLDSLAPWSFDDEEEPVPADPERDDAPHGAGTAEPAPGSDELAEDIAAAWSWTPDDAAPSTTAADASTWEQVHPGDADVEPGEAAFDDEWFADGPDVEEPAGIAAAYDADDSRAAPTDADGSDDDTRAAEAASVEDAHDAHDAHDERSEAARETAEDVDADNTAETIAEEAGDDSWGEWTPETSLPHAAPAAVGGPAQQPPVATPPPEDDEFIDLGDLLNDGEEEGTRFRVQETAPTGDEDRDFTELLNQFKAKVSEHLPTEDAVAHYDLGLAFKEMGLVDEAIAEFQIALRAGHMRLQVYEELGQCFLEKEQHNIAEKVLRRALSMQYDDELELLGVYYHLGRAYEGMGRRDDARDAYERVLGMDINFGDVTARLARL
jgi:tetratricopeptide (TPR) repeat protein